MSDSTTKNAGDFEGSLWSPDMPGYPESMTPYPDNYKIFVPAGTKLSLEEVAQAVLDGRDPYAKFNRG